MRWTTGADPCIIGRVSTPQGGIFALGTASHAYLAFDVRDGQNGHDLVGAISALREPRTTMGGVNLVVAFRPELWREVAPDDAPAEVEGFNEDLIGIDGFAIPATQHDALLWLSGSAYDVIFDTLIDAPEAALIPEGEPGTGGTILLLQKWVHDAAAWESLPVDQQEQVMGRTKLDSIELEDGPPDSHVGSTDQERFGKIFRRNMPYGTVGDHGTMFVGFAAEQRRLAAMLESMSGLAGGTCDALTRYTHPLTGAYYFVPSTESLRRRSPIAGSNGV
jgi:putative iron-dependent peroxidase